MHRVSQNLIKLLFKHWQQLKFHTKAQLTWPTLLAFTSSVAAKPQSTTWPMRNALKDFRLAALPRKTNPRGPTHNISTAQKISWHLIKVRAFTREEN